MTESGTRTKGESQSQSKNNENGNPSPGRSAPVDSGAGVDELARRLREAENVDPDLATIVAENWQKVLGALVCMLLVIWVVEEYNSAQMKKVGEASDKFVLIQETYEAAEEPGELAAEGAEDKNAPTVVEQNVKALSASSDTPFYSKTAPLYMAKLAFEKGDFEKAKDILSSFNIERILNGTFSSNNTQLQSDTVANELAALLLCRVLISENKMDQARQYLTGLAKAGTVTSLEALIALYRIAETSDQKAQAIAVAQEVKTAKPQYLESMDREFSALGVSLD